MKSNEIPEIESKIDAQAQRSRFRAQLKSAEGARSNFVRDDIPRF